MPSLDALAAPSPPTAILPPLKSSAAPPAERLTRILDALEIEVVPTRQRRGPNQTCAGNVLARILADEGEAHVTLLLRTIVDSEGNARALIAPVLSAISAVMLARPEWPEQGIAWIEAFDGLDLMALQKRARPLSKLQGMSCSTALAGILLDRLTPVLDPAPAPKLTNEQRREAKLQRKAEDLARRLDHQGRANAERIAIGRRLIELKASTDPRTFVCELTRLVGGGGERHQVRRFMRVAALYGDRPEICRRAPWRVLEALSAPSLAAAARAAAETRILAGERLAAKTIAAP